MEMSLGWWGSEEAVYSLVHVVKMPHINSESQEHEPLDGPKANFNFIN